MSRIFYPTSEKLSFLLSSIHNREVALPDFQRDFVWDPGATEELLESLCQNFPAGSLLRIKNGAGFYFSPREFAGSPALNGHAPSYLILDGQQRLTSLYRALYGAGDHRYFIDFAALLAGVDLEDALFYMRKKEAFKQLGSLEQQGEALKFPLECVFGVEGGFEVWLDHILEFRKDSDEKKKELKQQLREVRTTWIKPVEDYEFPMVTLAEDTKASAVCTIFETLNRTGVKLSVFDLLAARFWSDGIRLRDLWQQAQQDDPIIGEFDVDPYYLLQALSLVTSPAAPSCKRSAVLEMTVNQIKAGWEPVVRGLGESLHLLRDDCGVVLPEWLPYNTIIVPVTAALANMGGAKGPAIGAAKQKLKRWFWCSVFGQAYERAPNSQAAKDFAELGRWFEGGTAPETVTRFKFDAASLRDTRPRQRAVYRGVIALILRNGARDFHKGDRITAAMVRDTRMDDHHVFPQHYLSNLTQPVDATLRDCVLNRTLIDKQTNIRIGKRAPSDYLGEMSNKLGSQHLEDILRSHLLPETSDAGLWQNRFDDFLVARQQLLASQIVDVTS